METHFEFSLTKSQVKELFKKQARKTTKFLLIVAIVFICLAVIVALLYFFVEKNKTIIDVGKVVSFIGLFSLFFYIFVRCIAPKNAENYFNYHCTNDLIEFSYDLTDCDFVISQPSIGNVWHYKYEMINRVSDLGGYVAVMLTSNQFLPIIVNGHTAPLISTLKSVAKVKK